MQGARHTATEVPMPELATREHVDAGFTRLDARITTEVATLDARFVKLDARITTEVAGLDVKITDLRGEMKDGFGEMRKWFAAAALVMAGTVLAGIAAVAAIAS